MKMKMKTLIYVLILSSSSCQFDAGVAPKDPSKIEVVISTTDLRDMTQDAVRTPDLETVDVQVPNSATPDLTAQPTEPDMSKDLEDLVEEEVQILCDGSVVDLETDADHCGKCGNSCDSIFGSCDQGRCICPENSEPCGSDNTCKDMANDPLNCGGCGISCGQAAACVNSACVCLDGYQDCNGKCVKLEVDPLNCGACGNVCSANKSACNAGRCRRNCFGDGWACDIGDGKKYCGTRPDVYTCNARSRDSCGTECNVGERCLPNGGAISPKHRCRTIRPTIECQTCPCLECAENENCVVSNEVSGEVFCVGK